MNEMKEMNEMNEVINMNEMDRNLASIGVKNEKTFTGMSPRWAFGAALSC